MTQLSDNQAEEVDTLVCDIIEKLEILGIPLRYTSNRFEGGTPLTANFIRAAKRLDENCTKLADIMDDISRVTPAPENEETLEDYS